MRLSRNVRRNGRRVARAGSLVLATGILTGVFAATAAADTANSVDDGLSTLADLASPNSVPPIWASMVWVSPIWVSPVWVSMVWAPSTPVSWNGPCARCWLTAARMPSMSRRRSQTASADRWEWARCLPARLFRSSAPGPWTTSSTPSTTALRCFRSSEANQPAPSVQKSSPPVACRPTDTHARAPVERRWCFSQTPRRGSPAVRRRAPLMSPMTGPTSPVARFA